MKYIIGALLISSLIFFIVALLISATGFIKPAQNILPFGWIVWGILTALSYPLAKKIMA